MRQILRLALVATFLSGCSFVVTIDGSSHTVSVRPLIAATATLTPTRTPTGSSTPTALPVSPTPTQETTLPPPTATTTPRPTPDKEICLVKLGNVAINERTAPSVSAPKTSTSPIPAGSIVAISEFTAAEGYLWARDAFGWFVVREGESWWVTFTAQSLEWCIELPGYPTGVKPPEPIVSAVPGVWVGPGANRDELLAFGRALQAQGIQPAATVYGEHQTAELLLANRWLVLNRSAQVADCPNTAMPPEASATRFISEVVADVGTRAQIVVGANECYWPSPEWTRVWIEHAGSVAAALGVRALVPVVWNPGAPDLSWVPELAPAYRRSPIAMLWGVNLYPVRADLLLSARGLYSQFTTYRYELYQQILGSVPIVVTEYARGDGAQIPDFGDLRAWWLRTKNRFLVATAWYVAGDSGLGHWQLANLRGKLVLLAEVYHE